MCIYIYYGVPFLFRMKTNTNVKMGHSNSCIYIYILGCPIFTFVFRSDTYNTYLKMGHLNVHTCISMSQFDVCHLKCLSFGNNSKGRRNNPKITIKNGTP